MGLGQIDILGKSFLFFRFRSLDVVVCIKKLLNQSHSKILALRKNLYMKRGVCIPKLGLLISLYNIHIPLRVYEKDKISIHFIIKLRKSK